LFLGLLKMRNDDRTAALPDFRFVHNEADGRVAVDVIATSLGQAKSVISLMQSLGGTVRATSRQFQRISGRMPLQNLESLAASTSVKQVREFIPPYKNAVNVSEGDATHGGPAARSFYGVNGTGQKVC